MSPEPPDRLPAAATVLSFVDAVNRNDLGRLGALMTSDHTMTLLDEPPVVGQAPCLAGWEGYLTGWPAYVITPRRMVESGDGAAFLGHTTGSHLDQPDEVERTQTLVWHAEVTDGRLATWTLLEDTPDTRRTHGLD